MAWSRGAYNSKVMSTASMETRADEAFTSTHMLSKESTFHQNQYTQGSLRHAHLPHTFFPFSLRDVGDVHNTLMAGSTARACGDIMQAMEPLKRPLFWPFLDIERSLNPDHNAINEQSGSTSEFCNVSNTAMTERMIRHTDCSNEDVETKINEGESRIRKKKRLTGNQVHALESSFEADKKLEADRKQELAQRLGLEARQIAVWFQNRRARSKTKHLEHEFALLKSKYHCILADTHKLRSEVSRLTAELEASKCEAAGGTSCEVQIAPNALSQNSGANQYSTKNVKSNNAVEAAAHTIHESSNLLSKREGTYEVMNSIKQNTRASASMSCSQENSRENFVEGKYNTSPACISEEYIEQYAPCSELVACLTEAAATRFEHVDTASCSSLAAYLKKVNATFIDIHRLPAAASDDCLQSLSLWELTT